MRYSAFNSRPIGSSIFNIAGQAEKINNGFSVRKLNFSRKDRIFSLADKNYNRIQEFFYVFLFLLLAISAYFFFNLLLANEKNVWTNFTKIYFVGLLFFTWYHFMLLFYYDLNKSKNTEFSYNNEKITVIIPCFNEEKNLLKRAVKSIIKAKGNKEIIIIDDGSTNNIRATLEKMSKQPGIKVFYFKKNKGKRAALHYALKKITSSDYVVTVDSDTILDRNALVRVVQPLANPAIGAATGEVRVLNENQNWLTQMIGAYYWVSLNIKRKSQSAFGMVDCCSGAIAAYKFEILSAVADNFLNQTFFGEQCTFSEDRHLTNLVLKSNYDVVYVPEAIVYTFSPSTIRGFLRQQLRWKRGYIRESTYTLSYAWKTRKLLFFQVFFWDLTSPFITLALRAALLITFILNPLIVLLVFLPSWILFLFVRNIFLLLQAPNKTFGLIKYMLFYEAILYWVSLYALFTVRRKGWITR